MMSVVLAMLGIQSFAQKDGKPSLTDEQKTQLQGLLGEDFTANFEKFLSEGEGESDASAGVQLVTNLQSQHQATVADLQSQLQQREREKQQLQAQILKLANEPEPEPAATVVQMPRKEGKRSIMKVDLNKPHYKAVQHFMQNGVMASGATIDVADLLQEFGTYLSQGPNNFAMLDTIFNGFTSAKYFTEAPAVTERRAVQALITSVSQQFSNKWTPSGKTQFRPLTVPNRRHKINVPIVPSEVLTSYVFNLYRENLAVDQMPIFFYIWQNLIYPQLMQDIELRMAWKGKFTELNWGAVTNGQAGQAPELSMDGIEVQISENLAAGNPKNFRYFDGGNFNYETATDQEILNFVRDFVKWMAPVFRTMQFPILTSYEFRMRYREAYKNKWGAGSGTENHEFGSDRIDYSNKMLAEVDGMYGSPILLATPSTNLVKLRHINAAPQVINDVQKQDYEARIFGEYWMGVGFDFGEAVFAFCPENYDPHALVTSVYGAHTEYQQFKGTNPDKSVQFGSGSAGGGL